MSLLQRARASVNRNPYVAVTASAVLLVAAMAAVETSGVLPLEGQAMPTYGTLKAPGSKSSASAKPASSKSSSSKSSRSLTRAASSTSLRGAAASAPARTWTGKECIDMGSPDCATKRMMVAFGDTACFTDPHCEPLTWMCSPRDFDADTCHKMMVRRWAFDAFFPGCVTDECASDVSYLASPTMPDALKKCLDDVFCGELLAGFRRGEFECRRYEPCLDALAALTNDKACATFPWCAAMKKIDELYTKRAKECTAPDAACRTKIGIDAYAVKLDRRIDCASDTRCYNAALDMEGTLGRAEGEQHMECFLWPTCKTEFNKTLRWCNNAKREPLCSNVKAVWKFVTETNPACVYSSSTTTCQNLIEALLQ